MSFVATKWKATDLFSGCGGLTTGLKNAGFDVVSAVELDDLAADTYKENHPKTNLIRRDITKVEPDELLRHSGHIHLVAGCPPCQGFSRVRRRNRPVAAKDDRNDLILRFQEIVVALEPDAVFMENVPGIDKDQRFHIFIAKLKEIGYMVAWDTLELSEYGVPQRRSRVVVLAGKGFAVPMPRKSRKIRTVRHAIGDLPLPEKAWTSLHRIVTLHDEQALARIRAVPKDGGSRSSWPEELRLHCHDECSGFRDVYGRMSWDDLSPTITGGCINASKGRFLHPEQDRAITLFEAALLQTFARRYKFSLRRGRYPCAEMIGNALPPLFADRVGAGIISALEANCHGGHLHGRKAQ
jgi:DNA (cytosine-5)-methyltransferase 1